MSNAILSARWISSSAPIPSPVFRRTFAANRPESVRLQITGLGYFRAYLNGTPISADRFTPAFSDYGRRHFENLAYPITDELTAHRVYFLEYDLSRLVRDGENTLEIRLGEGFYRQHERVCEGVLHFGETLLARYALTLIDADGERTLLSDGSEQVRPSEITYSALFIGETVDARLIDAPPAWENAVTVPGPEGELCPQTFPADRLIRVLKPRKLGEKDGRSVYDAGENISGVVRCTVTAEAGETVTLRFAEVLRDGALDFASTGADYTCGGGAKQIMTDRFVSDGKRRTFEPKFVWHAFRYFDVEGGAEDFEVLVIHSDVRITAEFRSGSEGMNWLYDAYVRTQLNNIHGCIPSDCPHRERLGYTGDGQVCAPTVMMMADAKEMYRKWIRDILDCQGNDSGHIMHTAPFMGGGGGPGGWGCAVVLVPYAYWKQYGETDVLRESYDAMRRWDAYLDRKLENDLLVKEEEGGWCLGDWCPLGINVKIPAEFVNTCYYIITLDRMAEIASLLGETQDVPAYREKAQRLRQAAERAFYDPNTGDFCSDVQSANAYGLWVGLGDRRTADNLAKHLDEQGYIGAGFLGTDILFEKLFETGHADTACRLLESEEQGSFLYMRNHGATTVWETWDGGASHDHPMFGACVRQLFQSVLGIRQKEGTAGYGDYTVEPCPDPRVGFAEGSILTARGQIRVRWEYVDGKPIVETELLPL